MTESKPDYLDFLKNYDGPEVRIMEICGSHTAAIAKNGLRDFLSEKIRMVSGPGCPVCVTVTSYIDKLIALSMEKGNVVCTFGDLFRVPGGSETPGEARSRGGDIRMLYSPLDMNDLAEKEREKTFIFAAIGFETTAPVYAGLIEDAIERGLENVKVLTSLKTMPEVVLRIGNKMDGYLLPGHVCTVSGYKDYEPLAERLNVPMVAAGFEAENILQAVYALVKLRGRGEVRNFYPSVVKREGNIKARERISKFFTPGDASWRGLGIIEGSGLYLKEDYSRFDAGSHGLNDDRENNLCHCSLVITGEERSEDCPLFRKACTPSSPKGACMVSMEGACFNSF